MKILLLLLSMTVSFFWCKGYVMVVNLVPDQNEKISLTLPENVEVSISITFCLRFNLKDIISGRYMLSTNNDKLGLTLRFTENLGKVLLNGEEFYFKIQKDTFLAKNIRPFYWHHICICLSDKTFWVVVDGKQWDNGAHGIKPFKNVTLNQIIMGSTTSADLQDDNFIGEMSELNIWGKTLTLSNLVNITKSCRYPQPMPDVLQWFNITNSMLSGEKNILKVIKQLCSQENNENSYQKLMTHLKDQDGAIKTCKILSGQLASPKSIDEYMSWKSKRFYGLAAPSLKTKNSR